MPGSVASFRYWLEITPVELSLPAGSSTPLIEAETLEMMVDRLPADLADLADRLRREFWRCRHQHDFCACGLELQDLRIDRRRRGLVSRARDNGLAAAEPFLQRLQIVLAEIVVLVEHADLRVGMARLDVLRVGDRLVAIGRLPADGPRKVLGIVPLRGARAQEELRHLAVVEIFVHGAVGRRADAAEDQQHLLALDQPPGLLHRLGGL